MAENILIVLFIVMALIGGGLAWKYDHVKDTSKKDINTK